MAHSPTGVILGMVIAKVRQLLKDMNSPFVILLDRVYMGEALQALERAFTPYFEERIAGIVPLGDWLTTRVPDDVVDTYADYVDKWSSEYEGTYR
jgi:hypothetical protein